jgi:hypothetical protein
MRGNTDNNVSSQLQTHSRKVQAVGRLCLLYICQQEAIAIPTFVSALSGRWYDLDVTHFVDLKLSR